MWGNSKSTYIVQTASADAPWSNEQRHHDDKHSSPYRVRMMKTENRGALILDILGFGWS